jgi:hypothetical protein
MNLDGWFLDLRSFELIYSLMIEIDCQMYMLFQLPSSVCLCFC